MRSAGHDAIHLRDEGLHRLPNGDIFQKGFIEHRVVVTFDLDFAEIVAVSQGRVVSVVLFRLHNTRTWPCHRAPSSGAGAVERGTAVGSHPKLRRDVALKVLPKVFASDADRLARLAREARLLATLNHPNIAARR